MALIRCKHCDYLISDRAKTCPKCGGANTPDPTQPIPRDTNPLPTRETPHNPQKTISTKGNVLAIILLTVCLLGIGGGAVYYFYERRQAEFHEQLQQTLREEKIRKDSITAEQARIEQARIDSIRQDSIATEEKLRFSASTLITDLECNGDNEFRHFDQSIRENWEKRLKKLGFEKQNIILRKKNQVDIDDFVYDIYGIPYIRTLNGRQITVEPQYWSEKREQEWSADNARQLSPFIENFLITFSHSEDMEYFMKSISNIGLSKKFYWDYDTGDKKYYYTSDPMKYNGSKKINKNEERYRCSVVNCTIKSSNTISIEDFTECQ